jgi:hypothetical protein
MLQMFGQPYHPNTLITVPPDTEAIINRVSTHHPLAMSKGTVPRDFASDFFHRKALSQRLMPALSLKNREVFCFSPLLTTSPGSW